MDTSGLSVRFVRGRTPEWEIDFGQLPLPRGASGISFGLWIAVGRGFDQTSIILDYEANRVVFESQHNADIFLARLATW